MRATGWFVAFLAAIAVIFFWRQSADMQGRLDGALAHITAQNGDLGRLKDLESHADDLDRAFARALNNQDAMVRDFAKLTTPPDQAEARAAFEGRLAKLAKDLQPAAKIARDFDLSVDPPDFKLDPAKVSDDANAAFLAKIDADPAYQKTADGLRYKPVKSVPGGAQPTADNEVTVHYRGTFIDGTEFDSSYKRNEPATFPLKGVIPGWTEGVPFMKEGETFEFVIPYQLAYGVAGRGAIPPRQTLVFQVELLKVKRSAPH